MTLQRYYTTNCGTEYLVYKCDDGEWVKSEEHLAMVEKMKNCHNCRHMHEYKPVCDTCGDGTGNKGWEIMT